MTIYQFPIKENDTAFNPIHWPQGLSKDQVDTINNQMQLIEPEEGGIVRSKEDYETNADIRRVTCRTVRVDDHQWVFDMMMPFILEANQYFDFDIHGFMESMQYLHYGEDIGGGHYDWHSDCGPGISTRKLTMICQLSEPSDYEGCETEVFHHGTIERALGSVTIFPAYTPHRVLPLTKGSRNVLVAWVNGNPFR